MTNRAGREARASTPVESAFDPRVLIVCGAQFLIAIDYSIANVAIPDLRIDLDLDRRSASWVVAAYALGFGGLLLPGGRVADLHGRRRVFVLGLLAFGLASLAAGLAVDAASLIAARAVQGAAAGFVAPAGLGLLTAMIPEGAQRERALGVYLATLSAGFVAGMVLGGLLTELGGWRATMLAAVPVALGAAALARRRLPESGAEPPRRRLAAPGAVAATLAMASLVLAISEAPSRGWSSAFTGSVLGVSAVAACVFVAVERRARDPLVPRGLLAAGAIAPANALNLLLVASYGGMLLVLTLYLQEALGLGPLAAGLVFAVSGSVGIAAGLVAGPLAERLGVPRLLAIGIGCAAAGLAPLTMLHPPRGLALVLAATSLNAFGHVLAIVAASIAATNSVPDDRKATAGALLNVSQQLGLAAGVASSMSIAAWFQAGSTAPAGEEALRGWRVALVSALAIEAGAAAVALASRRRIRAATAHRAEGAEATPSLEKG